MDTCISKGKSTKIKYIAVIMMIITVALSIFQFKYSKKWVNYE